MSEIVWGRNYEIPSVVASLKRSLVPRPSYGGSNVQIDRSDGETFTTDFLYLSRYSWVRDYPYAQMAWCVVSFPGVIMVSLVIRR